METSFRKLIISLFVVVALAASMVANAQAFRLVGMQVQPTSGGHIRVTILTKGYNGAGTCCIFNMDDPGVAILMGLATAMQTHREVAWFINAQGVYLTSADVTASFSQLELWQDPALFPAYIPQGTPYDIILQQTMVTAYRTVLRPIQLLTTDNWYNSFGYTIPVGALATLLGAFSGQYGVDIVGGAPVTDFNTFCNSSAC